MKFFREERGCLRDLSFLAVSFGVLFFQLLGRMPLIDPDEGRYAEIPREMLERGDFITPMLNHVKYFEKPPLHYWLNALSLSVFGETEFAARFPGTLCGLLTVLLTYWVGRTLFSRRAGLMAAIVLGTAIGFVVQSRINFIDMTLTFCLSAAFACFILAARDGAEHKARDYYLFYVFMALAMLAKGLIGIVLPGAVIFLYLAVTRRWSILREMRLFSGTLLFLALSAPWFVLVSLRNPEFPHFFFIHEHFERFLTKVHRRYQPIWFFIPVLLGTMLPWSLFIPAAVRKGWRERKGRPESLFLLLWAGVIFAFFSKSNSKLIPYILPVFPPLALLIGNWFAEAGRERAVKWQGAATGVILLLLGGAALAYPHLAARPEVATVDASLVGAMFLVQGALALALSLKGEPLRLFLPLALSAAIIIVCAPSLVYRRIAVENSAKELARIIDQKGGKETKVVCFGDYQQGIAFYTHRRVILAGDREELEFGSLQGENSAWFLTHDQFGLLWDSPETVLTIVRKKELPQLARKINHPPVVIAEAGKRLLLANHPLQK